MKNGLSIFSVLMVIALAGMMFGATASGAAFQSTGSAATSDSTGAATPPSSTTETPSPSPAPGPAPTASGCTISPSSVTVGINAKTTFTATCSGTDGSIVSCPALSWSTTIGTVGTSGTSVTHSSGASSGSGTVTATSNTAIQAAGSRTAIGGDTTGTGSPLTAALTSTTAPSSGFSCSASITVASSTRVPATVAVTPASSTVQIGGQQTFIAHVYDADGIEMTGQAVTWSVASASAPAPTPTANALTTAAATSACGTIATDSTGARNSAVFTGKAAGACSVVARVATPAGKAAYVQGTAAVSVAASNTPVPTSIAVTPTPVTMYVGGAQPFTATVYDQFGNVMGGQAVAWSVSAVAAPSPLAATANALAATSACGTISPSPDAANTAVFTATRAGTCRMVAKASLAMPAASTAGALATSAATGISGYADITIIAAQAQVPTTVMVDPASATVSLNGQYSFTAHVYDQNGAELTGQKIVWSVSSASAKAASPFANALLGIGSTLAPSTACGTIAADSTGSKNSATFTARLAGTCSVVAKVAVSSTKAPLAPLANALAVTAGTGYIQGSSTVTVLGASSGVPTSIVVVHSAKQADKPKIKVKEQGKFTAYVYDQAGQLMNNVKVQWRVQTDRLGDAAVSEMGSIDQGGTFTGRLPGSGKVIARVYTNAKPVPAQALGVLTTANALTTSAAASTSYIEGALDVEVFAAVETMTCVINAPPSTGDVGMFVRVNTNTHLSASCMTSGGATEVVCPNLIWSSTIGTVTQDKAVGSVTYNSGSLSGTGSITATGFDPANPDSAVFSCSLPVQVSAGIPSSITVAPSSATVAVGAQQQFSATVRDEFGNELPDVYAIAWSVQTLSIGAQPFAANNQIGSVDQSGLFTARITGTGYAIATLATPSPDAVVQGKAKLQVVASTGTQTICALDPQSLAIKTGSKQAFTVNCMSADGSSDIACPPMAWSSTIGSVSPSPDSSAQAVFDSGLKTGTGTVTATQVASGVAQEVITCSAKVSVGSGEPGMPATVAIEPSSASLKVGQSQKFVATVSDGAGNLLDPNAQGTWYLQWSADSNIGKIDDTGLFAATSEGLGTVSVEVIGPWMSPQAIKASAKVSVSATQTGVYCRLKPTELSIAANADPSPFEVRCYDPNTPSAGPIDPEVMCPQMDWSATIGSISANSPGISTVQTASFTPGSVAGAGTVTAVGQLTTATVATPLISCSSPVTVTGGAVYSMQMVPSSASLQLGDTQDFDAYGYDVAGNNIGKVSDSMLAWTSTGGVGSVDSSGVFSATAAGSGTVKAQYTATTTTHAIEATAAVSVSSGGSGNGGNGGGSGTGTNNGGGSFASASTLSYTCSGAPGSLQVRILKPNSLLVAEIWGSGKKVFSESTSSDTTFQFAVPSSGDYEIRISVGTDQRSVSFNMPECTPATKNETKEINIQVKEPEVPNLPEQPVAPEPVAPAPEPAKEGIPSWLLLLGAVLLLAAAYFVIFGKKKQAAS